MIFVKVILHVLFTTMMMNSSEPSFYIHYHYCPVKKINRAAYIAGKPG